MDAWKQYGEIKIIFEKYCQIQEGKRYEDFIRELCSILKV
jgi:hypothetical protein